MRAGHIPSLFLLLGLFLPLLATSLLVGGCSDSNYFEPDLPAAGSAIVENKSPEGLLIARVVASDKPGRYMFLVEEIATGKTIANILISSPVGYYSHLVQIRWETGNNAVTAIIDHDFGEGNLEFVLEL
jgi:hypothetical protein